MAKRKFAAGPAATMAERWRRDLWWKETARSSAVRGRVRPPAQSPVSSPSSTTSLLAGREVTSASPNILT